MNAIRIFINVTNFRLVSLLHIIAYTYMYFRFWPTCWEIWKF